MPVINADASDGHISSVSTSSWAAARDAISGTADDNDLRHINSVRVSKIAGRGGNQWQVWRTFMYFNTSGVEDAPASAILKIHGFSRSSADLWVVKSTQGTALDNTDFNAITGWSAGADNSSNVTKYCDSEVTTWSTSGYNSITLNSTATYIYIY